MDKDRGQRMKIEPTLTTITASSTSHEMSIDPVNKPSHYTQIKAWVEDKLQRVEAVNIIHALCKRLSGGEASLYFNVMKYLWRYPDKNGLQDLEKAQWYLDKLIKEYKETHK